MIVLRRDEQVQFLAQGLACGMAEDLLGSRVPENDLPLVIHHDDGVFCRVSDRVQRFLAFAEQHLGVLAIGNVPHQLNAGDHLA